ncbi:unnamed protein product [Closterium sp. NIES-54]
MPHLCPPLSSVTKAIQFNKPILCVSVFFCAHGGIACTCILAFLLSPIQLGCASQRPALISDLGCAQEVGDLGYAQELGNYAEYSGAPNEQETLQYARILIDCATANPDGRPRALLIGGGIANFTDVAKTFSGIIQALREKERQIKDAKVRIFVRRGGPNYLKGLEKMRELGTEIGIPIQVRVCGASMAWFEMFRKTGPNYLKWLEKMRELGTEIGIPIQVCVKRKWRNLMRQINRPNSQKGLEDAGWAQRYGDFAKPSCLLLRFGKALLVHAIRQGPFCACIRSHSMFSHGCCCFYLPPFMYSMGARLQVYGPEASMTCICKEAIDYVASAAA